MVPRHIRKRREAVTNALRVLERNQQSYATVQVAIHDRTQALVGSALEDIPPRTPERLKQAIDLLVIRAEAYLDLVVDLESQKAYTTVLAELGRLTYDAYTNEDSDYFMLTAGRPREINACVDHWVNEGFRRLASGNAKSNTDASVLETSSDGIEGPTREKFFLPLLEAKGISKSKWASLAGVDPSVVYDYLSGSSEPRPDSKKALAEVLGLLPSEFPK